MSIFEKIDCVISLHFVCICFKFHHYVFYMLYIHKLVLIMNTWFDSLVRGYDLQLNEPWWTLVHIMVCCLFPPSHYLNPCWIFNAGISAAFTWRQVQRTAVDINHVLENYTFNINSEWRMALAWSHYLNQCWLYMGEVLWHSTQTDFKESAHVTVLHNEFENDTFEIIATSPRG